MAGNRSVVLRLVAEVGNYVSGMKQAKSVTDDVTNASQTAGKATETAAATEAAAAKKAAEAAKERKDALEQVGKAATWAGALTVAGVGATVKAAMDWQSAWTGVLKTVDGTPEQLQRVEDGLRGLARTLPSSHAEIAAVAEAAGQLGVKTEDVVGFTKVMIDMGQATNLSAEEAATTLARFMNIMGTSMSQVGRLGAAIVGLGNNYATTESEIAAMSMRLAGAGKQAGLSEGQVMGLAAAMSSVGIEAEAGGTAMSLSMKRIGKAVDQGGSELNLFARIAGMTSDNFAKAWKEDASGALQAFVVGLGKAGAEGESVNQILSDLGITGIREADAMLRLSAAGELMGDAMRQGADEYAKGTALVEEATKRYETAESKVKIAWNNIKDAAIDAGAAILPVVAGAADAVSWLASAIGSLPGPITGGLTAVAGLAGGAMLLGGALISVIPKIKATKDAVDVLIPAGTKARGVFTGLGKAAGVAAVAVTALGAIKGWHNSLQPEIASTDAWAQSLLRLRDNGNAVNDTFKNIDFGDMLTGNGRWAGQIDSVGDALNELINQDMFSALESFGDSVFGIDNGIAKMRKSVENMDTAMAGMASGGNIELAAKGFKAAVDSGKEYGLELDQVAARFPRYIDSLRQMATEAAVTLSEQDLLNWALTGTKPAALKAKEGADVAAKGLEGVGVAADGAVEDMEKFLETLFAAGLVTMSARDAAAKYQEALVAVPDALKQIADSGGKMGAILNENATDFDLTTEAGRLANSTFQDLARSGMDEVKAMSEEGLGQDALQGKLDQTYQDLIVAAGQFGITGTAAEDLARKILGVPPNVNINTWMSDQAKRMAEQTKAAVDAVPTSKTITFDFQANPLPKVPTLEDFRFPGKATGGAISGPGTGTSDTAGLFALSNGEHVLTAADVAAMGGQTAVYNFRSQLHQPVRGFAAGGAVQRTYHVPAPAYRAGGVPTVNLTAVVENPWTGDQVRAAVRDVSIETAGAVVGAAGRDVGRSRPGVR